VPKEDRSKCTDHMLLLLRQFEPCQFHTNDSKSSRNRDRPLGFPGLACVHCKLKRYFPLTEKKLQDSLSLMTTHIENCFHAPLEVKASLCYLQHRSALQKNNLASQWKFTFFKGVWNRLHQNYSTIDFIANSDTDAAATTIGSSVTGLDGTGRSNGASASKKFDTVGEDADSKPYQENLNQVCINNITNNGEQEIHNSMAEMKHLIKAAALWLSERDAENDVRARYSGGKCKGIKKR
jgi:hypothetical protein